MLNINLLKKMIKQNTIINRIHRIESFFNPRLKVLINFIKKKKINFKKIDNKISSKCWFTINH